MNFSIPSSRDELLRQSSSNEFYVDEVLTLRQLPSALQAFKSVCRSKSNSIVEHFNTLFSTLCLFKDLDPSLKEDAWTYLLSGCKTYCRCLTAFLDECDISKEERLVHLNGMKMTCYLLCQFLEKLDAEATQPVGVAKGCGRGRQKKSKASAPGGLEIDWNYERDQGVHILLAFIQLSLNKLWDPPVAEEEFVSLVSSCCYKLLENPSIVKNKDTILALSHIVGNLIKRYNHGLGASLKIDQLLKHFEFLTSSLVQLTEVAVKEHKCNSLVSDIIREIGNADCKELARDTSAAKAYCTYLVELSEKIPEVLLPYMSLVVGLLDEESYMLRNGVLGMMGEILVRHLCKGDLDDKQQATRDGFFDKLEDHLHDVNSYVRSKALQIWLNIVEEKCLPLSRQDSLMHLVVGRLCDKSSIVRKHAIQLVTALLKTNPFAAKLTVDELRSSYEKEKAALQEMTPEPSTPLTPKPVDDEMKKKWSAIQEELSNFLPTFDVEGRNEEQEISSLLAEEEDFNDVLCRIVGYLEKSEFADALHLMTGAKEVFPDLPMFSVVSQADEKTGDEPVDVDYTKMAPQILREIFMWVRCPLLTSEAPDQSSAPADNSLNLELAKQQTLVHYLKNSLSFAEKVQECIPVICQLLGSKNVTDVMEAVHFFVTAAQFDVSAALIGVRRMIVLIWSQESNIREAVVSAYQTLYLEPKDKRSSASTIVKNLSALLAGCTAGELSSMEAMVTEFVKRDHIGPQVIQALWERFIAKSASVTPQDSRAAVHLLAMCATAKPEIIRSNVEVLVQEGLGERAEGDFLLAHGTCSALLKIISAPKEKGKRPPEPFRFPADHELFERLKVILVKGLADSTNEHWMTLGDTAVTLIYKLAENPDAICGKILQDLMGHLRDECDKTTSASAGQGDGSEDTMKSPLVTTILARIFSMAGQVAFKQAVHLEVDVVSEMKRRHAILDEKNNKTKAKSNTSKANESEEEIALAGASAEDAEAEYVRKICEFELLENGNLLSVFHPLLVSVCSNSARFNDLQLQTSASLALAKFMIVSSQFCDSQLQLLFTLLEKSPSEIIRSNLIIALGDLTFRFPNLVEPWTSHLYARLRDDSPLVRKTTLQVLTHLILNDMVKVKGQISELAVCIVDEEDRISGLAKLFFHELSKKGNSMYNMPDIISRLSDPEIGVGENNFRTIIMFIFSHIEKSKHCESLTEKLCHRFRATRTERQVRDLSFCLSQLTYTEKGLAKLLENFPCYADKLVDDHVYDLFNQIITKSKQFAKQDTKGCLEELQSKLENAHNRSQDDQEGVGEIGSQARTTCVVGKKKQPKSKTTGKKNKKADKENMDDNGQEEGDDVDESSPLKPKRTTRGTRPKNAKPRFTFDSEDEDDDENMFFESPGSKGKEYGLDADDSLITRPSQKRSKRGKVSLTPLASPAT